MNSARARMTGCWLLVVSLQACGPNRIADASAAARTHLATFARFESWSTRVLESDVALHGEQALSETIFAPLRGDHSVVWAEVRAEPGVTLQYPKTLPAEDLSFVSVDAGELGSLRVAISNDCKLGSQTHTVACVVIAKAVHSRPLGEAPLTMAFRLEPAASNSQTAAAPLVVSASSRKPASVR